MEKVETARTILKPGFAGSGPLLNFDRILTILLTRKQEKAYADYGGAFGTILYCSIVYYTVVYYSIV